MTDLYLHSVLSFVVSFSFPLSELLRAAGSATVKSEVFSFGVVCYELFRGVPMAFLYNNENQVRDTDM
jgi:hypothetical protein